MRPFRSAAPALVAALWIASPSFGHAAPLDADNELAHTYFDAGNAHYQRQEYARAIAAFEQARRLSPLPALDYDLGRCHEALGNVQSAIEAYERFLAAVPSGASADEARSRLAPLVRLRETALSSTLAPPRADEPSRARRYLGPGLLLGGAALFAVIATGLTASVGPALDDLNARWQVMPSAALQTEAQALERRAFAGYALFGISAAMAVGDIAWWAVTARRLRAGR